MATTDWAFHDLTSMRMKGKGTGKWWGIRREGPHRPLARAEAEQLRRSDNAAILQMVDDELKEQEEAERKANYQKHGNDPTWRLTNEDCERRIRRETAARKKAEEEAARQRRIKEMHVADRERAQARHQRYRAYRAQGLSEEEAKKKMLEMPFGEIPPSPPPEKKPIDIPRGFFDPVDSEDEFI